MEPVEPVLDATIWPKLLDLATCLCEQITALGLPEPCMCTVLPGVDVSMDYCGPCAEGDKCGMAWTRLTSMYPSANFPGADSRSLTSCQSPLAFGVELGIARCISVGDEEGNPPPWQDLLDATQWQMADANAMRRAFVCCFGTKGWVLGNYVPFGPNGGCVGGTWDATVPEQ